MKRIIIVGLCFVLAAFAQATTKVVVKSEDTTVVKTTAVTDKSADNIGKAVAKVVVQAIDEADLGDEQPSEIRVEKEIFRGMQCNPDDEDCYSGIKSCHGKGRWGNCCPSKGHRGGPMAVCGFICKSLCAIVFFIMWIITLAIFGKGFSKIARAIEKKKE